MIHCNEKRKIRILARILQGEIHERNATRFFGYSNMFLGIQVIT